MPITHYPFTCIGSGCFPRPMLPVKIYNTATNQSFSTWGLIDTGADECAMPADLASVLGHTLLAGTIKQIGTGNGVTNAYAHTTKIELLQLKGNGNVLNSVVHTVKDTPIDFMPNLQTVLLGVRNFLSEFTLIIDYPNFMFSIKK